jgi:ABC-type transport system involved in multi-copper enzyme maturation permease subunit
MLKTWPMLKSLWWKELRELLPLIVAAIAAQGFLIVGMLQESRPRPDTIWPMLYMIAVLFAAAAGLWQTWRESFANHYQFLLHRPLKRRTIFTAKMIFGILVVLLFVALPFLCFSIWGDNQMRVHLQDPKLVGEAAGLCASISVLYLSAFLSGLRPGRWYGSQFLPLLAGILLYIVLQIVADFALDASSFLWVSALVAGPIIGAGFAIAILSVGRIRDFS